MFYYLFPHIFTIPGTAGDQLQNYNGSAFSTFDMLNGNNEKAVKNSRAGWWFKGTHISINVNGAWGPKQGSARIKWHFLTTPKNLLTSTLISVRQNE